MPTFHEFTEFIAQDGHKYKFDALDRFLITETGYGMPPIEYITQRGIFQHGETVIDFRLSPRVLQLVNRTNGCSRQDYWEKRSALINAIRPNRYALGQFSGGVLRKSLPNGEVRDLRVFIEEGPAFAARDTSKWDEWSFTETLRFIAHDPCFFNPFQRSYMWSLENQSQLVFPFTFPFTLSSRTINGPTSINYLGNWETYPKIHITGPINSPTITNVTLDEKIEMTYNVPTGRTVTIDLEYGHKSVTDDLGTNLIGTVTEDSSLTTFRIAPDPEVPGGANEIRVTGSSTVAGQTIVTIQYYERFIGI